MKLATWNVNSVRARLPRLLDWLETRAPDLVCLQEIKCLDEQFPREPIEDLGYHVETYGQKTYNGVAILSKRRPLEVRRGFPGEGDGAQARLMTATIEDLVVANVYVVNGESVGSAKYAFKMEWMQRLASFARSLLDPAEKIVMAGDFNVTFDDRDVYDPQEWREKILCSSGERAALAKVMEPGLIDAFRRFHDEGGHYTWWDFRTRGFQRNQGLRIDHLLMNERALAATRAVDVDREARGGEKPSDHAPVIAEIAAG
jgi:exodeoxyribonuclease-3